MNHQPVPFHDYAGEIRREQQTKARLDLLVNVALGLVVFGLGIAIGRLVALLGQN
jgi:hypothetical protein